MEEFALKSHVREELGRGAAKRLRREGLLPVNVYGHKEANRHLAVEYRAFEKFIGEGHRMLTLDIGGENEHGVVKEIQYDHLGTRMIHVDIARVDTQETITLSVPVETVGVSKGQAAGGTLDISLKEVHVIGPAASIPERIEIPIAALELGDAIRIRDLEPPPRCRFDHEDDAVVLAVHEKKGAVEEAPAEAPAAEEPEVISRKKEESEEGESSE